MKLALHSATVAVVALVFATIAQAQPGGGRFGGPGGGFGASRLSLCRIEAVQKELGLNPDQITAIAKLQDELRPQRGGGDRPRGEGDRPDRPRGEGDRPDRPRGEGDRPRGEGERRRPPQDKAPEARADAPNGFYFVQDEEPPRRGQPSEEDLARFRKEAEERATKEREGLAKILKPDQIKRLDEIYLQVRGVAAFGDADVAKKLNISDEQKEKFAKVREESATAMRELFGSDDREAARTKMAELRKQSEEKTLAVLNDDQKKQWEEMKGKKFEMPENAGRPERRRPENND